MHPGDPVNRFMSEPVVSIGPEAAADEALRLFMAHSIHHLPVVTGNRLIGVVSAVDITKPCLLARTESASVPSTQVLRRVRDVMSSPAIKITERESLQRAAEIMARNGIHSLPVVSSDDELIGIITTTDLIYCCLHPSPVISGADDSAKSYPLADAHVAASLISARRAVAANRDPYGIATTLLSMNRRVASLQGVATAAKRYLNAGQDEHLHAALLTALERSDRFDESIRQAAALALP